VRIFRTRNDRPLRPTRTWECQCADEGREKQPQGNRDDQIDRALGKPAQARVEGATQFEADQVRTERPYLGPKGWRRTDLLEEQDARRIGGALRRGGNAGQIGPVGNKNDLDLRVIHDRHLVDRAEHRQARIARGRRHVAGLQATDRSQSNIRMRGEKGMELVDAGAVANESGRGTPEIAPNQRSACKHLRIETEQEQERCHTCAREPSVGPQRATCKDQASRNEHDNAKDTTAQPLVRAGSEARI
jgi:hypothetical protein